MWTASMREEQKTVLFGASYLAPDVYDVLGYHSYQCISQGYAPIEGFG
jgi:hypothetical protein